MAYFDGWEIENMTDIPDDKIAKVENSILITDDVNVLKNGKLDINEVASVTAVEKDGTIDYESSSDDKVNFVIDEDKQKVILKNL